MPEWLYAIACVAVPCAIGTAMFGAFEAWDRLRRRSSRGEGLPVIDYTI